MSLGKKFLNWWLRLTEKPHLERVSSVRKLRRSLEFKARISFFAPWGTQFENRKLGDVETLWVNPHHKGPVILYLHGGANVMGSPRMHRAMLGVLSKYAGLAACLPKYRLAPEHPFPAALDDANTAYATLIEQGYDVILGGDSAGGGLALALLGDLLRTGQTLPVCVFALSPLTDLTFSGGSVTSNAEADVVLPASRTRESANLYVPAGVDAKNPRVSALFADLNGAPPVWLTAGDTEILLDDTRRMADQIRATGGDVTCVIENDLPHVWTLFHSYMPEARATLRALAAWLNSRSPTQSGS